MAQRKTVVVITGCSKGGIGYSLSAHCYAPGLYIEADALSSL